jgi:hypothetical protein
MGFFMTEVLSFNLNDAQGRNLQSGQNGRNLPL